MEGLISPAANPTKVSPPSPTKRFTTSPDGAPVIIGRALTSHTGEVQITRPNSTVAYNSYTVKICALGSSIDCQQFNCPKAAQDPTTCSVASLAADTTYVATVGAGVKPTSGGGQHGQHLQITVRDGWVCSAAGHAGASAVS